MPDSLTDSLNDFVWADKPAGITTHTSLNDVDLKKPWIDKADGFMEWLATRAGHSLFPVHRLDRETTGAILFARTREAAERARAAFEARTVDKQYLFITDKKRARQTKPKSEIATGIDAAQPILVESFIERVGNDYVSTKQREPNSRTLFELVRTTDRFSLWSAKPESGKPHQIRLHAEDIGLSLLGDTIHGGSTFPTLCLHAHSLTFEGVTQTSPPPLYFDDLHLLSDSQLVRWLAACDRRERALRSIGQVQPETRLLAAKTDSATDTLRWIHTEGDPLRLEQLGEVASLNWFRDSYPSDREWISIEKLLELKKWSSWYLQIRANRGKDPHSDRQLMSEVAPPDRWTAFENGLKFEFRRETGLSPGLFLDQRRNRAWIQSLSEDKRVLNLFCYTGGFSVAAAAGGASQVVSVDVSKPFLEWSKENFALNDLDPSKHEFRAIDSGEYLAWAAKKDLKFDLIVCDPPSFARTNTRGKSAVFRIETEFENLLSGCLQVAAPGGRILFSLNYEQWSFDDFAAKAQSVLKSRKHTHSTVTATPSPDLDFELPRAQRHMKSLVIAL